MGEQQAVSRVQARDRDESLKGTETKAAFKTTEFLVFLATVAGILIAAWIVEAGADGEGGFAAVDAWRYVAYVAIGYMVSRGLAKAGSRNPRPENE
jgi:hypothetical protein